MVSTIYKEVNLEKVIQKIISSFSTQIDYEHLEDDNPLVTQVHEFLEQVLPIPRVKDYVLKILGSVLSGKTGQEKFHIWTGCHAKGTPILMYDGILEK